MATYITMFRYTLEGVKGISAHRTGEVKETIQRVGGRHVAGYELLGEYDVLIVAEYPDERAAIRATIELNKIMEASSHTMIAIPIEEFDQQNLSCFL